MPFYDPKNKRLVYTQESATPDYWDKLWASRNQEKVDLGNIHKTFVSQITKRYLKPEDGRILEGGCGSGQHVAALTNNNYACTGIDYASRTVAFINQSAPNLDVRMGDVTNLEFEDAYFVGYWSLGVIEHFWDGYDTIGCEMKRVLMPGGYLFITFPYLSPLRKFKIFLKRYPQWEPESQPKHFYQFALSQKLALEYFRNLGFHLIKSSPLDGIKGFKSECRIFRSFLQKLYDYRGSSFVVRGVRIILTKIFALFAGHMVLLVLKKDES